MKWRKLGLVFCPDGSRPWARSYALSPTVDRLDGDRLRVYYASLDSRMLGHIGVLELDARNPLTILYEGDEPVLSPGTAGTFDDCGVNPSCIVSTDDGDMLFYIGWQRTELMPQMNFAGAARILGGGGDSRDLKLERISRSPILERSDAEPFLRSATTVLRQDNHYRCFYNCGDRWIEVCGKHYPRYTVHVIASRHACSWPGRGRAVIDLQGEDEFGLGRPWIVKDPERYLLFYSIRSTRRPYRIGYAVSKDGENWQRRDDLEGLETSESGWDSEMMCYACVVDAGPERFMFYNGNQHGKSGFGVAVLEQD